MGWVGEVHLRARVENDELVDKQILCTRCGGPAKVASTLLECTQCETWPKYGAGLDRIWSIRRQRQNSFCNSSAEI